MKVGKDIVELFHKAGPWCTVHVDVSTGTVDSLEAMDVLADHIKAALAAAGASKEDVALAASLTWRAEGVPAPCSRYVLIRNGQVEVNQVLRGTLSEQLIGTGAIPNLVPLLSSTDGDFNYVVVEAERSHAEVRLYRVDTVDPLERKEVQGDTENLRKVPGGGLSQGHYQYRTQEIWRRNADQVATAVDAALAEHGAELVLISGDVRARQLLIEELGAAARPLVRTVDMNSQPPGADRTKFELEVERHVAEVFAGKQLAVLDRLSAADGQHRARGWGETVIALQLAQVDVLLLEQGALKDKSVLVLDAEPWIATSEEERLSANVLGRESAPAALVRAAAVTDAQIEFVAPGSLADAGPAAALLRWPTGPAIPSRL